MERNFKLSKKGSAQTILMKTRLYSKVASSSKGFKAFLIINSLQDAFSVVIVSSTNRREHFTGGTLLKGRLLHYISYGKRGSLFVHIRNVKLNLTFFLNKQCFKREKLDGDGIHSLF